MITFNFEYFLPALPSIKGPINTSRLVSRIEGPKCGYVGNFGIDGVQLNASNVLGFLEAEVIPCLSIIIARINSCAGVGAA